MKRTDALITMQKNRTYFDLGGSKFTGIVLEGPKLKTKTVLESDGQTSHHDSK